jgi:hypothetical protein
MAVATEHAAIAVATEHATVVEEVDAATWLDVVLLELTTWPGVIAGCWPKSFSHGRFVRRDPPR